ncbi:MAG: hypothetical protein ACTHJN_01095 [Ginsengibacter sp.]
MINFYGYCTNDAQHSSNKLHNLVDCIGHSLKVGLHSINYICNSTKDGYHSTKDGGHSTKEVHRSLKDEYHSSNYWNNSVNDWGFIASVPVYQAMFSGSLLPGLQ